MYLNSRGLLSFPSLSFSRNSFFCRAALFFPRPLLLPPSASLVIGVTCSLGPSFYGRLGGETERADDGLFLSLSALRPSSSRPPRCSRLARLPLFPSISNYGFPRIARTIFSPIPVKGEGNGKTWRANPALLGIELSRLRSISNGGSPDFLPPPPPPFVTAFL